MKTKLLSFKLLLLVALSVFSSNAWGQTATITITQSSAGITQTGYDSGAERAWTQNGVSFGAKAVFKQNGQAVIQTQANNGVLYNTTALPGKIVSIIINQDNTNASNFSGGNTSRLVNSTTGNYTVTGGTQVGGASSVGWTNTDFTGTNYTYFAIKRGSGAAYWSSVVIEYETAPSCAAPTLSPTLSTAGVTTVAANITGNVTNVGGGTTITARGIQYSTSNTMAAPTSVASGTGTGSFTSNLTGLTANTLYYYRAYATNDCATPQTGYSHTSGYPTFTTYALAPTVTTATAIGTYGFTANWSAPTQGNASMTYTLEYSTDNTFATGVTSVGSLSSTNRAVSGLLANTNYYYRVKIVNAAGDSTWSGTQAVTTLAPANHLGFNPAPPTTATVGANLTQFKVEARRPDNTVDASVTGSVTLTGNIVSGTGNIAGTTTATFTNGVATFGAVQFDATGTYTITASSGALTNATSSNIVISPNPALGYFRSKAGGSWSNSSTWETSTDGIIYGGTAVAAPTSSAAGIIIDHDVTVAASASSKNVTVNTGKTLILNHNFTMSGANVINGTLSRINNANNTLTNSGTLTFGATGTYLHAINGGAIVTATWDPASTAMVTGMSTTAPSTASFNQTFGNFIWNSNQTGTASYVNLDHSAFGFTVKNLFSILNTGDFAFVLSRNVDASSTFNFGNLLIKGNAKLFLSSRNGSSKAGIVTVDIMGDMNVEENGSIDFGYGSSSPISGDYRSIINLGGHLNVSSGAKINATGSDAYGLVNFDNTEEKNLNILSNNTLGITFDVLPTSKVKLTNNLTLGDYNGFDIKGEFDLGTHEIVGANDGLNYFYNYPDSTLKIAHPQGIGLLENNTYPTTGAVRVDANGAYPYDIDGNYIYYGTANQITGTGLPEMVKNLTINNTGAANNNEVTLTGDLGLSKDLKVTSGIFNINDKEVVGDMNITGSDITVASNATLKIGGTRPFPIDFTTIHLDNGSLVDYAGDAQTVANASIADYTNMPAYSNLQISGTGVKTATGTTLVNNIVTVASGELKLPETADNVTPNVLEAKQGIHNTGGMVTFENNAVLMQDTNANNIGAITVKRHAHVPANQYNLWSSPVEAQDLYALYGAAGPVPAGKVMEYITKTDTFKPMAAGSKSASAKGYSALGLASNDVTAIFNGVPHNGLVSYDAGANTGQGDGYNLIGNPYPSNFDLDTFYTANASQLDVEIGGDNAGDNTAYFWDNTSNDDFGQWGSSYEGDNYAYYNFSSKSGVAAPRTGATKVPNNIIKPGQGFIVKLKKATASLSFDNTMRTADNTGSVYFKTEAPKRYWLELTTPKQLIISTAVVYNEAAVNTYDKYDTAANTFASDGFYTMTSNAKAVSIQGRQDVDIKDDVVPVGIKAYEAGDYSIRFAKGDNIFADGQDVYLKDNSLNKIVKLTDAGYHFALDKGVNTTRFEIVYQSKTLAVDAVNNQKDIVVYKDADSFVVKARSNAITKVEVYDMLGRLVLVSDKASKEVRIANASLVEGTYVLKISQNNNIVTQKVIK